MSYARFGDGSDIYVYSHVGGGFECCACTLANLTPTVFTEGCDDHPLFKHIEPCENCHGVGCDHCMMHGNTRVNTRSELITHIEDHIKAGHKVPEYVIERLRQELEEAGEENEPMFDDGYDGPVAIDFVKGTVKKLTDLFREDGDE